MKLIQNSLLAVMAASGLAVATQAIADDHQLSQAPGFYRMNVGDFVVMALNDGTSDMAAHKLLHWDEDKIRAALAEHFMDSPVEGSINGFLVDTGAQQILIDTGMGKGVSPSLGKLTTHLAAAGYTLEDIDAVYITHFHGDHVSGLVNNGERVFPNAKVYVHERDADAESAQAKYAPYRAADAFVTFADGESPHEGIKVNPTPGHTPGHSVYHVESGGQTMVVWGDTLHVAGVQFAHPEVTIQYDSDPDKARAQRLQLFEMIAENEYWVAGAHIAFPGIGRLKKENDGYRWVPANYTTRIEQPK
ncbi:MAG: MBL fold metallo-hydrolase [Idiomarinaceae bacterium]|nr:MBL fold metallo-hydrolase [Idiomarinaceae bacterium]|tara:strand:- start:944 stop:1855 length:912 start_codon:yes stop_codon:yes gene_type:complete